MKALILAGGRGKRLDELTEEKNKSMLEIFEKTLIEYNLDHAVEAGVSEMIIVVGYKKEDIMNFIGEEYRGIKVSYSVQEEQRGLVHAIECAKEQIGKSDFILMLADEIVVKAKVKEMIKKFKQENLFAICGVVIEKDKSSISKTYSSIGNKDGQIFRLIEKPRFPLNEFKGTGHCVFKNEILEQISRTPINAIRGEKEMVDMIQCAIDEGKKVHEFIISTKGYVNVNSKEDLILARKLIEETNPKVLIIHTQMKYFGGAELLIVELANWLTKRGIKNDILALSKSKEVERMLINTEIIIPKHNIDLNPPGFKTTGEIINFIGVYRRELRKIIKNYDVLNFHNFPVTWCLWPRKKPSVWMLNEPPNLWSKPDSSFILKQMNKIRNYLDKEIIGSSMNVICVADEFNKTRCKERYKKNPWLIYYGVNYDFFSNGKKENAIKKYKLRNKFVVIQSGMITPSKNQLASVQTIKEVKEKIPEILLILAGKPEEDYKKKIEGYIHENNLQKSVLFTGNLGREELRDLYSASDIGLFPVGKQGGWLAPFEMLCSGNPIIVSEQLGAASIIKDFNLGEVTSNYSKSLINSYNQIKELKKGGDKRKRIIKQKLGWNIFGEKMINAIKYALNQN